MTALDVAQSGTETVYPEPYNTIAAVALAVLMVAYLAGLPATVTVAALYWPQRTRAVPAAPHPPAGAAPSPAGQTLLHLQRLERRVLELPGTAAPAQLYLQLATETEELITRHGERSTVGRYAVGLQVVVAALAPLHTPGVAPADPPEPADQAYERLPDRLRVGLARLAAEGRPVPEQWALSWYLHLVGESPAGADPPRAGFARAFLRRYRETYPHGGMIVALTGERLAVSYRPASARYAGRPVEIPTDLPEIAELPDAVRRLRAVGESAASDVAGPTTPPG